MTATSTSRPLPADDLAKVVELVGHHWEDIRGARLFVTGGTGFVGRWMLESLLLANRELGLGASAVVLSRDPGRFAASAPHLAGDPAIEAIAGDVSAFEPPPGEFTHVLHMATETNADHSAPRPTRDFDVAVEGTRAVLRLAGERGARRVLYTSSGAVYGRQPADVLRLEEDSRLAPLPNDARSAYGEGKRAAEFLCAAAYAETGLETVIARLFAFVGPLLALDAGFAVGNFVRDAMAGEPIRILGDGTTVRSYLYAGDLAWWLWTVLVAGEPAAAYNVGSEEAVSILELARTVSAVMGHSAGIEVAQTPVPGAAPARYVPDTTFARTALGLKSLVPLADGIRRTAAWHDTDTTRTKGT